MRTWLATPSCELTLLQHDGRFWCGDHIVMLEWICRPGRLDKMLYIPLPAPEERAEILTALVRSKPLTEELDVKAIARDHCHGFSGADLSALVREAATNALKVRCYLTLYCSELQGSSSGGDRAPHRARVVSSHSHQSWLQASMRAAAAGVQAAAAAAAPRIEAHNFQQALERVKPSVSPKVPIFNAPAPSCTSSAFQQSKPCFIFCCSVYKLSSFGSKN